jgi:glutathione synthase/RimK-type ligase-like ATP-grasp enzyme
MRRGPEDALHGRASCPALIERKLEMHIVIVNRWPRFREPRRWDNELTRYEEFFDHARHQISYVVDGPGAEGVLAPAEQIACQVQVEDVNDYSQLLDAVREVSRRVGPVDQLIALSEFTLEIAGRVRQALGIPGHGPEQVAVYRDKARMKEVLQAQGVRVPAFARCQSASQSLQFAEQLGYPLIVKPVDGAASIGVHLVATPAQLQALLAEVELDGYEIEEYIQGEVYHVDGFVDAQGRVAFQVVSRYVNSCLDFAQAKPLGSVVVQRSALRERIEQFSIRCLQALGLNLTAFHLELFITATQEPVFLEVGARVGGSEVPHLIKQLFGVNLYEYWLRSLGGEVLPPPQVPDDHPSGGWLVIPKPQQLPCRVLKASRMKARVPSIWRELVPEHGEVLAAGGSYDALHSGRFIFTGGAEGEIEADIRRVINEFEFQAEAV